VAIENTLVAMVNQIKKSESPLPPTYPPGSELRGVLTSKSPRIPCALGRLESAARGPGDIPLQLWSLNERTVAVI
jgi:hypothetical protein